MKIFNCLNNKKMIKILVVLISILSFSRLYSQDCFTTINSIEAPIKLENKWYFKKGDALDWKNKDFNDATGWSIVKLPDFGTDKKAAVVGYHWYRCTFTVTKKVLEPSTPLAIKLGKIRDADEVYLNGNLIGSTGKFTPLMPEQEIHRVYSLHSNYLEEGKNVIAVRVYSSTNEYGIALVPEIYYENKIHWKLAYKDLFKIMSGHVFVMMGIFFIIASIVFLGVGVYYSISSVVHSPANISNLFFSIFSILLGYYVLLRSTYRPILSEDFIVSIRYELLALIPLPVLFLNFLIFHSNLKRPLYTYVYEGFIVLLSIFTLFSKTPAHWKLIIQINAIALLVPAIASTFIIYSSVKKDRNRMIYILVGTLGLLPCAIVDLLTALRFFYFMELLPFGFMFFLINISIQLSEEMVENYKNILKLEKDLLKMERSKTNFLFNISDEFKYYSGIILESVKKHLESPFMEKKEIQKLINYTELSSSLIKDAVLLDSIERKDFLVNNERFSIREVITEILTRLETRGDTKSVKIEVEIQNEDIFVIQSRELVFLILYHLIENAYNYSTDHSSVFIKVSDVSGKLHLVVEDNGEGMTEEEKIKVFKKFVRGDNVSDKILGSGIGLNLVQSATSYIRGIIDLETYPKKGCKFTVILPYIK